MKVLAVRAAFAIWAGITLAMFAASAVNGIGFAIFSIVLFLIIGNIHRR